MLKRLSVPGKLVFTVLLAACGDDGGPSDGAAPDGRIDTAAAVDSRLADAAGMDACPLYACRPPSVDGAPGIDAAVCPDFVCDPEDCPPPCELLA